MNIQSYSKEDCEEVIALVLSCQNDGTRPLVSIDNQPELLHIKEKYIDKGGNFWVAKDQGMVVGCIGLQMYDNGIAILKKFFVNEHYRSNPHHLGGKLYGTLLEYAKSHGVETIILDTPKNTDRAHKFYEKAEFKKIKEEELPIKYNPPYEDSDYFLLSLTSVH